MSALAQARQAVSRAVCAQYRRQRFINDVPDSTCHV